MTRNRIVAALALVAGVAGGGVAGALLGVPGISGAQTDQNAQQAQPVPNAEGPGRGAKGQGCHRGHPAKLEAAAKALGMSVDDLRAQLRQGKTIAAVAKEKGVDVKKVIDAMVAEATARIDKAQAEGRITAEEAARRKQNLTERITRLVNEGPPRRLHGPEGTPPPAN